MRRTTTSSQPPANPRKIRSDAQKNRERILEIAKEAFTRDGAAVSMDEIARTAVIGSGTLYRHFPNREALIEALYRSEVEKLAAAEERLAAELPPLEALRAWMNLLIDHVAQKKLILPALELVPGGSARLLQNAKEHVQGAFVRSIRRAMEAGDLRPETEPGDIVRALIGCFHTMDIPGWEASARRLADILITGSRTS